MFLWIIQDRIFASCIGSEQAKEKTGAVSDQTDGISRQKTLESK